MMVSLVNFTRYFKIFKIILSNLCTKKQDTITDDCQSGFMQGRPNSNNICLILDLIDYKDYITEVPPLPEYPRKEEITTVKQVSDDHQKRIIVMEDKMNKINHCNSVCMCVCVCVAIRSTTLT